MNQRDFIELVSGRRRGVFAALARKVLWWASLWYGVAVLLRLALYRMGLLPRHAVSRPVVCVGNLTAGGTGKTPAVAAVTARLAAHRPAIVSRGYRAGIHGNDEMRVLEELCPGTPHIQNPDRVAGARAAIEAGAGVVVLDDGFSHLHLRRDLDIVLVDALNPLGYGRLLPRGLMREPRFCLRRAHVVVITRADVAGEQRLLDVEDAVRCTGFAGSLLHAGHIPVKLVNLATGKDEDLAHLKGLTVAPFCGIGNPEGFGRTLESLGAKISQLGVLSLGDHADFSDHMWQSQVLHFARTAREGGADAAVCTQKDAVKLRGRDLGDIGMPLYELRVEFRFLRGEDVLQRRLETLFKTAP